MGEIKNKEANERTEASGFKIRVIGLIVAGRMGVCGSFLKGRQRQLSGGTLLVGVVTPRAVPIHIPCVKEFAQLFLLSLFTPQVCIVPAPCSEEGDH